jgi:hypothetical protein
VGVAGLTQASAAELRETAAKQSQTIIDWKGPELSRGREEIEVGKEGLGRGEVEGPGLQSLH